MIHYWSCKPFCFDAMIQIFTLIVTFLSQTAAWSAIGKSNFEKYETVLPNTFDVVSAGGWNHVYDIAGDPKSSLVDRIVTSIHSKVMPDEGEIDALVGLLQARGNGFKSDLVDGEWSLVYNRSGNSSPKIQKAVARTENEKNAFSNFDIEEMKFLNLNFTPRKNGYLEATVKYNPVSDGFTKDIGGHIIIRRISCDIVGAGFKYRWFPYLPLPLRSKGGYLDFLYLDEDIRVTKGNRGGLFVHFRPAFLEKQLSAS